MKIRKWTVGGEIQPNLASVTTTSSLAVNKNDNRHTLLIQNVGTEPVLLNLGGTASTSAYHIVLAEDSGAREGAGGAVEIDQFIGEIYAIVEANTSVLAITEL